MSEKLSTQPYKGTRDFYPEEMRVRNWFFSVIREVLESSAYEEYNAPMLESLELYAAKSGEEIANEQTYHFTDRAGRNLAIRPEMTPSVARMVAAKMGELNFPLRWFSFPNMYRYEKPQRGRLREFWQVNVDIFGCDGCEADLDCIVTAIRLMRAFGADETMFKVHISNRRFFNDAISSIANTDMEGCRRISKIIDKRNKIPAEVYRSELEKLGLDGEQIDRIDSLYGADVADALKVCPGSRGAEELESLFAMLENAGLSAYCEFDFGIIRGLDYYTGTVFEVYDNAPENNRAMFGGGRYDNLVGLFANNAKISGVGFGLGDVTLENFLGTHKLIPETLKKGAKVLITRFPDVPFEAYVSLQGDCLAAGLTASVYLGTKKFGKQIDYAVRCGYTHVLTMGSTEYENGTVRLKDLAAREETEMKVGEALNLLGQY